MLGTRGAIRRNDLTERQEPFAIVLGCSDSRVPAEIVFDQGLGDLFVIRVAGNIVAPSQVGSVEFAAEQFGTRLVVVLGHSRCGAIEATARGAPTPVGTIAQPGAIVDRVRPSVEPCWRLRCGRPGALDPRRRARQRARLGQPSPPRVGAAGALIDARGPLVVGAEYSLETGVVDFFDGMPTNHDLTDD